MQISHLECLKNPDPRARNRTSKKAKTEAAVVDKWEFRDVTQRWDALPMQSHNAPFSAPLVFPVDPTAEGILADDAVDGIGVEPAETLLDGNSLFDENEEIMASERRDFDDIHGIEFDLLP